MTSAKLESTAVHKPIWESSRRPLHPKCVWIESSGASRATKNGHRHFIFDYNLTNSYRPRSDASLINEKVHSCFTLEKSQSLDVIENKLNCLSIIGSGDKYQNEQPFSLLSNRSEVVNLLLTKEHIEPLELNFKEDDDVTANILELTKDVPSTPSMIRISNEIDTSTNLLADRVLQWLDLAGGRNYVSANRGQHTSKISNAPKRRSVTAKELHKLNEPLEETGSKPKMHRQPVRQSSMTFNKDDCKETQNPNQTIVSISFGDWFPAAYKCSRKFLALRRPKNITDALESLDLQSSIVKRDQRPTSNRFGTGGKSKPKRYEYFDEYHSMIQRQILETSCNTQVAKRQLHIFMPNLPKKNLIVNDTDRMSHLNSPKSGRDNDSCSSCRLTSI